MAEVDSGKCAERLSRRDERRSEDRANETKKMAQQRRKAAAAKNSAHWNECKNFEIQSMSLTIYLDPELLQLCAVIRRDREKERWFCDGVYCIGLDGNQYVRIFSCIRLMPTYPNQVCLRAILLGMRIQTWKHTHTHTERMLYEQQQQQQMNNILKDAKIVLYIFIRSFTTGAQMLLLK